MSGPFDRVSGPILQADIESMRDGYIWGLFPISMEIPRCREVGLGLLSVFIPYVGPGLLSVLENRFVEGVGEA